MDLALKKVETNCAWSIGVFTRCPMVQFHLIRLVQCSTDKEKEERRLWQWSICKHCKDDIRHLHGQLHTIRYHLDKSSLPSPVGENFLNLKKCWNALLLIIECSFSICVFESIVFWGGEDAVSFRQSFSSACNWQTTSFSFIDQQLTDLAENVFKPSTFSAFLWCHWKSNEWLVVRWFSFCLSSFNGQQSIGENAICHWSALNDFLSSSSSGWNSLTRLQQQTHLFALMH